MLSSARRVTGSRASEYRCLVTGRTETRWLEAIGHASCLDAWLGTLDPSIRRSRGIAIDRLVDEVVYRQLVVAEERPTLVAALASLSSIADDARADLRAQQVLAWLFAREPRLRDLGALFVHAALRRAQGFLRVQRFYPAVMLQRILDTIDGAAPDDHGTMLVWNILVHHEARALVDDVVAVAAPIARGYESSVAWPTSVQAARLAMAVDAMRAPWEGIASTLLHAIENPARQLDEPLVARLAGTSAPLAQPLRELTTQFNGLGLQSQARLLRRAMAWPSRSARVLSNLAAEYGLQRLYYAYLHDILGGIEAAVLRLAREQHREIEDLTPESVHGAMPELFERDCVWPMAVAMDSSFAGEVVDLFSDEPTLNDAGRQRLRRQRDRCFAASLQQVDDETMQMLDDVHARFYCQEVGP
jgi:hypothetical protein